MRVWIDLHFITCSSWLQKIAKKMRATLPKNQVGSGGFPLRVLIALDGERWTKKSCISVAGACGNRSPTMPNKTQHNLCQKPVQIELNQAESMCEWARTTTRTRQQGQTETGNGRCVLKFVSACLLLKFNATLFVDLQQEKRIVKSCVECRAVWDVPGLARVRQDMPRCVGVRGVVGMSPSRAALCCCRCKCKFVQSLLSARDGKQKCKVSPGLAPFIVFSLILLPKNFELQISWST